jgi:CcmD family protein
MLEFMAQHQLFIVLGIVLLVWAGIISYLVRLDGKVKKLEQLLKKD